MKKKITKEVLTLPKGYKELFRFKRRSYGICLIMQNKRGITYAVRFTNRITPKEWKVVNYTQII